VPLGARVVVTPLAVPHRAEFSDCVMFCIQVGGMWRGARDEGGTNGGRRLAGWWMRQTPCCIHVWR
jgi:hypothetical protein